MMHKEKALDGTRIGVLGKGGSGKSTVSVLLAMALARLDYNVSILDADSTNVGLHQALGITHPPRPLLEYFGGAVFNGGAVTCPVDDPTLLTGADLILESLPHNYYAQNTEGIFLLTAGKIGEQGPGAGCDGPVAKIARDLRLLDTGPHPVMLVDFKAGFEDSARGAITSLDRVLVVIDPTQAAINMAVDMAAMVRAIKAGLPPATQHLESPELVKLARRLFREARIQGVHVVLNKVANAETEIYLRQALAEHGIEPVGIIYNDVSIARAWLKGESLLVDSMSANADPIARALETVQKNTALTSLETAN